MHPLSFYEFLGALGKNHLVDFLKAAPLSAPIPEVAHQELLHLLKLYYRIGGMPEAVWKYVTTKDMAQVSKIHTDLVAGFRDDFSKYGDNYDWSMLNAVFTKLPRVVGTTRVKYSQLDPDLPSAKIKLALSLFRYADLVHFVHSSSAATLPLSALSRDAIFKLLFVDIGLLQHVLGFDWGLVTATPELTTLCDGRFAEQFVGQEILATRPPQLHYQLHYWDREQQGSQAEVDYLIECKNRPAPIEIKSGTRGSLKSLTQYVKEFSPSDAFVLSQRNIERMDNVTFLPLYLAARLS
jgi:predicted AAA+ superfamily ATPase